MKQGLKVKKPENGELNEKQQRFCQEYLISLDIADAYLKAGYHPKDKINALAAGCRLLSKASITRAIQELKDQRAERARMKADDVLDIIERGIKKCMQDVEVIDIRGNPTGEYKFDSAGLAKLTEQLGRHLGLFERDNLQKRPEITMIEVRTPPELPGASEDVIDADSIDQPALPAHEEE